MRYIGYLDEYYSDTFDNPVFIYMPRMRYVYFRSDYDCMEDVFIVEGTDMEVVLGEVVSLEEKVSRNPSDRNAVKIVLSSKTNPRIKCDVELLKYRDTWYSVSGMHFITELSDEIVQEFKDNGIIE